VCVLGTSNRGGRRERKPKPDNIQLPAPIQASARLQASFHGPSPQHGSYHEHYPQPSSRDILQQPQPLQQALYASNHRYNHSIGVHPRTEGTSHLSAYVSPINSGFSRDGTHPSPSSTAIPGLTDSAAIDPALQVGQLPRGSVVASDMGNMSAAMDALVRAAEKSSEDASGTASEPHTPQGAVRMTPQTSQSSNGHIVGGEIHYKPIVEGHIQQQTVYNLVSM
jgi:hypothetical protein